MISTITNRIFSVALSFLLVLVTIPADLTAQAPAAGSSQPAPFTAAELQQLVAPIALYPDALVAQVLGAATFPDQVAYADDWLHQNKSLTGSTLMKAVDAQNWDPSVKAVTQFPSVLDTMAKNLNWTSTLGEAYHTQTADVMAAVQVLRAKAKSAGNLKSGSQIVVVQESPQVIVIQPANPQVVYVPQYNPAVVYGTPYATPGYSAATVATTAVVAFGVGIAVGAMMNNNSCCGWGYSSWNCNWHSTTVVYRGGSYYGNAAWSGGYNSSTGTYARGGTVSNGYGSRSAGQAYNPTTGTYARGTSASNAYGSAGAAQAYNPRTGASAATVQGSNANGSWGSSTASRNGQTAYTQHQTTAQGSVGTVQTTTGARGAAATGANGNSAAVGQTANGNKYAASSNGNAYQNTGSGWQQTQGTPHQAPTTSTSSGANSAAAHGYGGQQKSTGTTAFSGSGGGWGARSESARGNASRSGGHHR